MKAKFLFLYILLASFIFSQEDTTDALPTPENENTQIDETTFKINNNNAPQGNNTTTQTNVLGITDYLLVVFVLIVVLGALYFVLKLIRKVGGSRVGIDNDLIHVISTRALKGTTALHLIEVGNQIFLVGATDSSINRIAEITDQESKDMISLNLSTDEVGTKSFLQFFTDKLKNLNEVTNQEEAKTDLKTQKEKLDRF